MADPETFAEMAAAMESMLARKRAEEEARIIEDPVSVPLTMMVGGFDRLVSIGPAYDRRDPDPTKNYGIGACTLRMLLRGPLGAVHLVVFTAWHLPHVQAELDQRSADLSCHPMASELGYHALKPAPLQWRRRCDVLPGGICYGDGSALGGVRVFEVLLQEGDEGVWRELELYYRKVFQP